MPEILGIIPARAGSKRVPGKNLRMLQGKALVQYSIEAALDSRFLTELALSSDSTEVLTFANAYDKHIHALSRPDHISTDDSPAMEYILHALEYFRQELNKEFEFVVIIQPSSPLTKGFDIDNTIQLLLDHHSDCAVSVRELQFDLRPSKLLTLSEGKLHSLITAVQLDNSLNDHQKIYVRNGSVYVSTIHQINKGAILSDNCSAYIMPSFRSVDINDEQDLLFAEFLLQRSYK
jgi:CMP-N-acetylneuraminic acid synthetase